ATELWMNFKGLPYVGNLRAGNFKNPIGMEHLTSSRFLPFIERSFNQDVFYGPFNNGFVPGVMLWDQYAGGRGLWATGVFRETKTPYGFGTDDGSYMWTSRVTYLLWYDECSDGRSLFHVGASNNLIDPIDGAERYRARPSLRNGPPGPLNPVFADTGTFPVELAHHLGFEAAWNYGSLTMQAEYTPGFLHDAAGARGPSAGRPVGDEFIQGGYVQALYFLTGEHMLYDRTLGAFTRVVPHENAYVLKGLRENIFTKGAWQVGFRYAYLDLDSSPALDGGILNDYTFGLNWYFNPNAKVQWNYVLTHRDVPTALGRGGFANGFGMRLAWDF
ncbi:MAG TPA: porin, partial [Planctomycetaceae bacterium]